MIRLVIKNALANTFLVANTETNRGVEVAEWFSERCWSLSSPDLKGEGQMKPDEGSNLRNASGY